MITGQTQPLDLAKQVLTPETIRQISTGRGINYQGKKILDRWAFNNPVLLRQIEAEGLMVLQIHLYDQQVREHNVLMLPESIQAMNNGLMEHELLEMHGINTELHHM